MTDEAKLADWEAFVIANGWQAQAYELAAIVGQSVDSIQRLRTTGACSRLDKPKDFANLFALWHGREPGEDDWPAPRKVGAGSTYEWQAPEVALLASADLTAARKDRRSRS
ncbi:MAG: regulatory protein MerR [Rhodocyclaceae bacterium]|nr:MAG: regulatory protein MerR [Rhodocyclaceae bacterium]